MSAKGLDRNRCYRAVQARDARFDGRFFTGVLSTGIYCRPVCPARCPARKQCVFFACSAAAQDAGFRACRRCRPESAPGTPAWNGSSTTVARALSLISRGELDGSGSVEELGDILGVSARHLRRLFAEHLGTTPISIAQARRVEFAKTLLDQSALPMTEIASAAGFASLRRFNSAFLATFACSPSSLRSRLPVTRQAGPELRLKLAFRDPYDFAALLGFFEARAIPGVECVEEQSYRRSVCVDGPSGYVRGYISVRRASDKPELLLTLSPQLAAHSLQLSEVVRSLFDLRADPKTFASHLATQAALRPLVRKHPGVRLPGCYQLFELAVRALLGQHISVKAATTLSGRLVARYGEPLASDEGFPPGLTHLFPRAERLQRARVETIGLPRARAQCLRDLSRCFAEGRIDHKSSAEELRAVLLSIRGIGPWTAAYVSMRSGNDPDALPAGDLVLRRSAAELYRRAMSEAQLRDLAQAWTPWRSYAAMLLWRHDAERHEQ